MSSDNFCSKILLFGEYLVVKGSHAVAIPFEHYSGRLTIKNGEEDLNDYCLRDFGDFLSNSNILANAIDTQRLIQDIERGLFFDSNIPLGYGVGSSGALCASIFKNYQTVEISNMEDLGYLRDILSFMESFFHGLSSGLDPLVSYIQGPIEVRNRNHFKKISNKNFDSLNHFYLVDTGISRKTAPLVHKFLNLCEKDSFKTPLAEMIKINNSLVEAFLENDLVNVKSHLYELSYLQYLWFDKMIPASFRKFWLDALESKKYIVKLCGAGGGGFLLVYSEDGKVLNELNPLPLI